MHPRSRMPDALILGLVGFARGLLGSVPLTGPIAVMAVGRAVVGRYFRGFLVGVGGTMGELIYCGMAVAGIGAVIDRIPALRIWV